MKTLISVVEDQSDVRRSLVKKIDRTEGLICISNFENAEDALEKLPIQQPNIVLMDIGLPKMNGVECMIRISLKAPEIKFLMFTVFDNDEYVFDALQAGAVGYVLKSEGATGAIHAIQEYLQGGAPMSRDIARKVLERFQNHSKNRKKKFEQLTPKQMQVLELIAKGLLNKEIADIINVVEGTVKIHCNNIYKKLEVNNRAEAIRKYLEK